MTKRAKMQKIVVGKTLEFTIKRYYAKDIVDVGRVVHVSPTYVTLSSCFWSEDGDREMFLDPVCVSRASISNIIEAPADTFPKAKKSEKWEDPIQVGQCVLIRSVTQFNVGRILHADSSGILLGEASWVADTGRWGDALLKGFKPVAEIEPYVKPVRVSVNNIMDVTKWRHKLPTKQQ